MTVRKGLQGNIGIWALSGLEDFKDFGRRVWHCRAGRVQFLRGFGFWVLGFRV